MIKVIGVRFRQAGKIYYFSPGKLKINRGDLSLIHIFYFTQNRIIKELADKGQCVIVGRCADYILREREDCLNVFIFADNESKIERAEKYFNITREEAPAVLKKKDKARANHYKYYTDQEWGMASNYDLLSLIHI